MKELTPLWKQLSPMNSKRSSRYMPPPTDKKGSPPLWKNGPLPSQVVEEPFFRPGAGGRADFISSPIFLNSQEKNDRANRHYLGSPTRTVSSPGHRCAFC